MLKTIHIKIFSGVKLLWFLSICKILTVDSCNMDECLESSLAFSLPLGQPGVAGSSHRSDIYLRGCGLCMQECLFIDHHQISCFVFVCVLNFRSRSRLLNYFNSEIFPILHMHWHTCMTSEWGICHASSLYLDLCPHKDSLTPSHFHPHPSIC